MFTVFLPIHYGFFFWLFVTSSSYFCHLNISSLYSFPHLLDPVLYFPTLLIIHIYIYLHIFIFSFELHTLTCNYLLLNLSIGYLIGISVIKVWNKIFHFSLKLPFFSYSIKLGQNYSGVDSFKKLVVKESSSYLSWEYISFSPILAEKEIKQRK